MGGLPAGIRAALQDGRVIPAHPLALDANGRFDEHSQRALTRYYSAAGVGGLAVGVHTTQFAIRDPSIGLFEPVLTIAAEEMDRADARRTEPFIRIGGICGATDQALREAEMLARFRYHAGLLSLAALRGADDEALIAHCEAVAARIPVVGFYLQTSVGGRPLTYAFWRRFAEIPSVVAIKIAPFNRYQTLDVVRAVIDAGRDDIALYTGNDDSIVHDLVTPFRFIPGTSPEKLEFVARARGAGEPRERSGVGVPASERVGEFEGRSPSNEVERRIAGGLLGHWAVWTKGAVRLLEDCRAAGRGSCVPAELLQRGIEITDANAAFFDAPNNFAGCIAGIQEVLRRQGLVRSARCLDPDERLSPGQSVEIDRVCRAYPHLADDDFIRENLDEWMRC